MQLSIKLNIVLHQLSGQVPSVDFFFILEHKQLDTQTCLLLPDDLHDQMRLELSLKHVKTRACELFQGSRRPFVLKGEALLLW